MLHNKIWTIYLHSLNLPKRRFILALINIRERWKTEVVKYENSPLMLDGGYLKNSKFYDLDFI